MNSFALLNDSDDDEQPKVVAPQKKVTPKDVAPKRVVPGLAPKPTKATTKTTKTTNTPPMAVTDDGEFTKENSRGGARGKESKQKEEYRKKHTESDPTKKHERDKRSVGGRPRGEQSKGGRGAHGFGSAKQDAEEAQKDPESALKPTTEGDVTDVADEAEPEEEEPPTRSMDEFMAQRAAERAKLNAPVKAREVSKADFAGLASKEEETWEDTWTSKKAPSTAKDTSNKEQRSTVKDAMPIVFKFKQNPTADDDRGDRGGRGGSRGGRGGERGPRPDRAPREGGDRPERAPRGDRPPREGTTGGRGGGRGGDRRDGGGRGGGRGRGDNAGRGGRGGKAAAFNDQDFPSL